MTVSRRDIKKRLDTVSSTFMAHAAAEKAKSGGVFTGQIDAILGQPVVLTLYIQTLGTAASGERQMCFSSYCCYCARCMYVLSVRMDVSAINMTLSEYEKKLPDPRCCLTAISVRQHLTLPPKCLGKMADGIREQLDARLKLYSEEYVVLFLNL